MSEAYNKDRTKQKSKDHQRDDRKDKSYVRRKELYKRENRQGNP